MTPQSSTNGKKLYTCCHIIIFTTREFEENVTRLSLKQIIINMLFTVNMKVLRRSFCINILWSSEFSEEGSEFYIFLSYISLQQLTNTEEKVVYSFFIIL